MKKARNKLIAALLVIAMCCTTFMSALPSLDVLAAGSTVAHLKAGSGNGNNHFGGAKPEAFVLSDRGDITNEDVSFQFKLGSEKDQSRFRFVTKYVNDDNWAYIAYDGKNSHWFIEYKINGSSSYPDINGLPAVNTNDVVNVSTSYETDGLYITVEQISRKRQQ